MQERAYFLMIQFETAVVAAVVATGRSVCLYVCLSVLRVQTFGLEPNAGLRESHVNAPRVIPREKLLRLTRNYDDGTIVSI